MEPLAIRLGNIAERYGLRDFYVFGSRADEIFARVRTGASADPLASSDVDIAVQPHPNITLTAHDRVRLTLELEDLFSAPRVDLVVLSEASPFLALEVIRGELLYTADEDAQAETELYVLRRAADLAPLQRERVQLVLKEGGR